MDGETRHNDETEGSDELVAGFVRGDGAALEALYRRYAPNVYDYVLSLVGRRAGAPAEDLVQDVFVRAHRYRHTYQVEAAPLPWLLTIARNEAARWIGRRGEAQAPEAAFENALSREADPLAHLEEAERQARLAVAWEALPEISREILHLRYREGLGLAEVSSILGVPRGVLAERSRKALERLRNLVSEVEVDHA